MLKNNLLTLFLILFVFNVSAQSVVKDDEVSNFSLDGEFRTRLQYTPSVAGRNMLVAEKLPTGEKTPSYLSAWQRTRVIASYNSKRIESKLTFQDSRPFLSSKNQGQPYWASADNSGLTFHEAWAKYYLIKNDMCSLGLKLGRQELSNSDGRILSSKNWAEYAAAFDAIKLEGRNKRFKVDWDLAWAINSVDLPTAATTPYKSMVYLEVKKYINNSLSINALGMSELFEETGNYDDLFGRHTLGINPVVKFGDFKAQASFYKQFGLAGYTPNDNEIRFKGMVYTVSANYKYNNFVFGLGFDSYSGSAYDDTDVAEKSFLPISDAGHAFFGTTDFNARYGKKEGLSDIYLKTNFNFSSQSSLKLAYYNIWFTNSPGLNSKGKEIKSLGNNIDLEFHHSPVKNVKVVLAYSVMLPSDDFVEMELGPGNDAKYHGWAWAMIVFKPNFFKFKHHKAH